MIKAYYELAKPGIIYGNALAALAGFFLASLQIAINWPLLIAMLVGLSLIIGAGCVFNNYADREIDARMERTKERAMVSKQITPRNAIIYGVVLLVVGVLTLLLFTNLLTLAAALVGFAVYVFWYTPLKPKSPMALFVGAIAGAMPPVVGYVAVSNSVDYSAAALFFLLYIWQIPHFLAIATYRYTEYSAAGVPLFIHHEPSPTTKRYARMVFFGSLVVLTLFCLALILQRWIR